MCCVKRVNPVSFILLSAALIFWGRPACAFDWKQLHERANNTSLADAQAATQKDPGSADNLYLLGLVCLNLHQDEQAKDAFDKILSQDQENYPAQWGRAEVLRREHRSTQAEKILASVMKAHPDFSPAYITLAAGTGRARARR